MTSPDVTSADVVAGPRTLFRPDRRALTLLVLALAVAAWLLLALGGHRLSHDILGGTTHHHGSHEVPEVPEVSQISQVAAGAIVLGGWLLMVVAMMLPPALPMLDLLRQLVSAQRHPRLLIAAGGAAFVAVWTAAGAALVAGDTALHATAERSDWFVVHPEGVAGLVLVGAGGYQFTPLKDRCLRACRSLRGFAVAHWRGRRPAWVEASTVAASYAASCVGCCWALMAVCFVVGVAALPAMVVLTLLMAAERLTRWGRALVRPAGLLALALGIAVLFGLLPPGPLTA